MRPDEYRSRDAVELAQLVRQGEVQPRELAQLAGGLIDAENPKLNAVIHRFEERVEQRLQQELSGPLAGVPFLLKDQLDLEGTAMTLGSALLQGFVCDRTHPLAHRMEDAGLVILGRTNMSELGMVPTTEPRHHGATRNPWHNEHSAGGSSGGSAAAVAAGWVPVAHAVDGGGSIRIPAAACGLFGLKPSRGRNPTAPYDDPDGFVAHHCLSHTVRDSAAFLDATEGSRRGRWRLPSPTTPYAKAMDEDPGPLRIALTAHGYWGEPIHPDALEALQATAKALEARGHHIEEVQLPFDGPSFAAGFRVLWASATGVFFRLVRENLHQTPLPRPAQRILSRRRVFRAASALPQVGVEPFTRRLADFDQQSTPSDLWLANMMMQETAFALDEWFDTWDLWLTPLLTGPAMRLGELDVSGSIEEIEHRLFGYVAFTPVANTTGLPAMAVPAGLSAENALPLGVHAIAPLGREDRLFQVARQLEEDRPWPRFFAS